MVGFSTFQSANKLVLKVTCFDWMGFLPALRRTPKRVKLRLRFKRDTSLTLNTGLSALRSCFSMHCFVFRDSPVDGRPVLSPPLWSLPR